VLANTLSYATICVSITFFMPGKRCKTLAPFKLPGS
jgi:hypothetical protein